MVIKVPFKIIEVFYNSPAFFDDGSCPYLAVAYPGGGGWGVQTPLSKFQTFDKAEPK
jgi:hypothetical protein